MKIVIKDIKTIEEGREIGQILFIRANSKQIENMSLVINSLTTLLYEIEKIEDKRLKKEDKKK